MPHDVGTHEGAPFPGMELVEARTLRDLLAGGAQRWGRMGIGNASLTVLAVRPDGTARLVMYSDVGHLPVDKQTWSGRGVGWGLPAAARR